MSSRGSKREHQVADGLRRDGCVVYRSAGSHGCADLIALKAGAKPMLVQVKGSRRPFEHFGRADRLALACEAIAAGADAWLVHWPPYGQPRWCGVEEWPSTPGIPRQEVAA